MSKDPVIVRLEAIKRSLEAARDAEVQMGRGLAGEYLARTEYHMRGLQAGLQISIDVIDAELLAMRGSASAGEATA